MNYENLINNLISKKVVTEHRTIANNYKIFLKRNPICEQEIIDSTPFCSGDIRERLYCILHNITEHPKCIQCGGLLTFLRQEYRTFCSPRCAQLNKDTQAKHKDTTYKRYGVTHTSNSVEIQNKKKQTCLDRYGVEHHWKNPKIQQKRINTFLSKYGVINPQQSNIPTESLLKLNDEVWMREQHNVLEKTCLEIANDLNVDPTTVANYFHLHDIHIKRFNTSSQQKEIASFLKQYTQVELNDRNRLSNKKEIDIFLPEFNIGIEFCGLFWHSDYFERNTQYVHVSKLEDSLSNGIQLITVFEDEWLYRRKQVEQKLLSLIRQDFRKKVFARSTVIGIVSKSEKKLFFNETHIQGNGPSSLNFGLFHKGELVACLGMIQKQGNTFVINRYSTKYRVVGGFGKLLHYFMNNFTFSTIETFADRRWGEGNMYEVCGFDKTKILPPDYRYIQGKRRIHKFNFRHTNLSKILQHYDSTVSEHVNCRNNNIFKIWDCGLIKFTINTKQIKEPEKHNEDE